jgi:hypothetical protein
MEYLTNYIDFVIPDEEFAALNKLDKNARYNYPFRWGVDVFGELGAAEALRENGMDNTIYTSRSDQGKIS